MRVLVGCEQSGVVRRAFRERGHDAWSCDVLPAEDNSPYHHQGDLWKFLEGSELLWDMALFFPPCTHLACSGAAWFEQKRKDGRQQEGIDFFMRCTKVWIPKIVIENPVGIMSTIYRKPDQIIHPWQFGHGETKATCLWLKGLPKLVPTNIVSGRVPRSYMMPDSKDQAKKRSRTYDGIGKAFAEQWG